MASSYAYFAQHIVNSGEFNVNVASLYKNRPKDSRARFEEIYAMLADFRITRSLLNKSKVILFADEDKQEKKQKNEWLIYRTSDEDQSI